MVAGLTAVAAGLRLWRLGEIPPGLHVDEAFNLIDARAVLVGWRPIFLPANAGREVLFTYVQAALIGVFGDSIAVMRSASAVAGTIAVPATWLVARALAPSGTSARRVALLAAAFVAGSFWHLHFSRFGIRAVLFTPFAAAAVWAWWRTLRAPAERVTRRSALAGGVLGLAAYVHPAGRGLFAVPLAHALVRRALTDDREALRKAALCVGWMLAFAFPLLWFWAVHPWLFFGHAGEVSIVGSGPGAVASNAVKVIGSFNVVGDPARWRNLPGRPAFDAVSGAAFLLGIAYALRAARRGDSGASLTLIWLALLLIPSIVTDAAPNFSRAIGALPAACLLAAIGLERAATWMKRLLTGRGKGRALAEMGVGGSGGDAGVRGDVGSTSEDGSGGASESTATIARAAALGVMLAVPLYGGLRTTHDYFRVWAPHPETAIAFDDDIRRLAEMAQEASDRGSPIFLSPETASHATVRAMTGGEGLAPLGVDTERGLVLRHAGHSGDARDVGGAGVGRDVGNADDVLDEIETAGLLVGTYTFLDRLPWEAARLDALMARTAGFEFARVVEDEGGRTVRRVLVSMDDLVALRPAYPITAGDHVFGGVISLEAAHGPGTVMPGAPLTLTLVWSAGGPTDAPLHTAVQLIDAAGDLVGSGDARPLGGEPPTDRWQEGDVIIAEHAILWVERRAEALAPGDSLTLRIGWYRLEDGSQAGDEAGGGEGPRTVAVPSADGEDLVTIGTLRVGAAR